MVTKVESACFNLTVLLFEHDFIPEKDACRLPPEEEGEIKGNAQANEPM